MHIKWMFPHNTTDGISNTLLHININTKLLDDWNDGGGEIVFFLNIHEGTVGKTCLYIAVLNSPLKIWSAMDLHPIFREQCIANLFWIQQAPKMHLVKKSGVMTLQQLSVPCCHLFTCSFLAWAVLIMTPKTCYDNQETGLVLVFISFCLICFAVGGPPISESYPWNWFILLCFFPLKS